MSERPSFMKNLNPRMASLREGDGDYLYHLGLVSKNGGDDELKQVFGDTSHIATMGSGPRAFRFADALKRAFGEDASLRVMGEEPNRTFDAMATCQEAMQTLERCAGGARAEEFFPAMDRIQKDLAGALGLPRPSGKTERYWTFVVETPVGGVVCVNHHMGEPTHAILLEEMTRLMCHVGADRQEHPFEISRWGTSGGLWVPPGTVVVARRGLDPAGEAIHKNWKFGKEMRRETGFTDEMRERILFAGENLEGVSIVEGDTVSCSTFHIDQGRVIDASTNLGTDEEKMAYLRYLYYQGARNMEMEGKGLAAHCNQHGIPVGMACVTLLDRSQGDQVTSTPAELLEYSGRPQQLFLEYMM
ncbi:MAG: hypothetical protein WC653_05975, partial [Candidatus Gracilibacteria bacterium]